MGNYPKFQRTDAKNKSVRRIRESVAGAIEVDKTYSGAAPARGLPDAVKELLKAYLVEPVGTSVRLAV